MISSRHFSQNYPQQVVDLHMRFCSNNACISLVFFQPRSAATVVMVGHVLLVNLQYGILSIDWNVQRCELRLKRLY